MTDMELLARSSEGDETAFQNLYERHVDAVFRFAWLLTASRVDAEDITQESFILLIRKAAGFDPSKAQLRTWLLGFTRHLCRRRMKRNQRTETLEFEPRTADTLEQNLIHDEDAQAVRAAVAALPETQREALFLFEFEGLSLKDVAAVLHIDPNAVKARLYRGREQLKRSLVTLHAATGGIGRDQ